MRTAGLPAGAVGRRRRHGHRTRTAPAPAPVRIQPYPDPVRQPIRTTDAKQIGLMYLVTSFAFFLLAGLLALLMRAELAEPGLQFRSTEQYNQLSPFTAR